LLFIIFIFFLLFLVFFHSPFIFFYFLFSDDPFDRLLAISFGESTLTPERWRYAGELEGQRQVRVRAHQKGNPQRATPLTSLSS